MIYLYLKYVTTTKTHQQQTHTVKVNMDHSSINLMIFMYTIYQLSVITFPHKTSNKKKFKSVQTYNVDIVLHPLNQQVWVLLDKMTGICIVVYHQF